jgi:hypothetical protein
MSQKLLLEFARQIVAASEGKGTEERYVRFPGQTTVHERQAQMERVMKKEAQLTQALQSAAGLNKIAANMANPVRFRLDYKGIWRKFAIVEQMPDGVPLIYDKDQPLAPAVKVGKFGTPRSIEMVGKRVEIQPFEIASRVKVPYSELYNRRYRALDRSKDRLIEGMELREDLIGYGLFEAASGLANTPVSTLGVFDRNLMARGFNQIERNRLSVGAVLMSTAAVMGIRRLQFQDLDQMGMQEVRETGYLGSFWGADFYVSDQVPQGTAYALTTPKYLAWLPIRKDVDVIPADDPDNLRLGFVGYELIGMTVFNALGVEKMTFDPTA